MELGGDLFVLHLNLCICCSLKGCGLNNPSVTNMKSLNGQYSQFQPHFKSVDLEMETKWMLTRQTTVDIVEQASNAPRRGSSCPEKKLGHYLIGHMKLEDSYLLGETGGVV